MIKRPWDRWERLSESRKKTGMTQKQVAEKLGVGLLAYNRWENGQAAPDSILTVLELSQLLNVSIDYLLYNDSVAGFSAEEAETMREAARIIEKKFPNPVVEEKTAKKQAAH